MYYDYFGLNQAPFKITPDTSLFFPGGNRGAILEALMYAIVNGEGIVKVVGEVGSGKTMLCRMLEVELPDNVEIVYLANPSLSPDNILHAIAFELALDVKPGDERLQVMNRLQHYLLDKHANNQQVVVFVEEAQSMPIATLEEIRLLSNLETGKNKLLQIVLFGQPELDQMIGKREIRQLKERITYSFNLNPLKSNEIKDYLNSRLRACGYRAGEVFSTGAIKAITRYSNGLLRRINILADKSMLSAYATNQQKVTTKHVKNAARDSEFISAGFPVRFAVYAGIVIIPVLLMFWFVPVDKMKQEIKRLIPLTATAVDSGEAVPVVEKTMTVKTDASASEDVETIYHTQDTTRFYDFRSPGTGVLFATDQVEKRALADNKDTLIGTNDTIAPSSRNPGGKEDRQGLALSMAETLMKETGKTGKNFFAWQGGRDNAQLSQDEANLLLNQLEKLPPEAVNPGVEDGTCELCASIIYRPLVNQENL